MLVLPVKLVHLGVLASLVQVHVFHLLLVDPDLMLIC